MILSILIGYVHIDRREMGAENPEQGFEVVGPSYTHFAGCLNTKTKPMYEHHHSFIHPLPPLTSPNPTLTLS